MSNQDLIIIEQLPVITQKFRDMAVVEKEKIEAALAMPCTADTKIEVKKLRSDLNKDKADLEARRIAVKRAVMKPYDDMEAVYKAELLTLFTEADKTLAARIAVIEDAEKAEKEANVKAYYTEYAASLGLVDIPYEAAKMNVTLTAGEKALKEQAKGFLDNVQAGINAIMGLEHGTEIMIEFRENGYSPATAISRVNARYAAIEREKERLDAMKQQQEAAKVAEAKVDAVIHIGAIQPGVYAVITEHDPNEIVEVPFTAKAERYKLRALREYMTKEGIHFV